MGISYTRKRGAVLAAAALCLAQAAPARALDLIRFDGYVGVGSDPFPSPLGGGLGVSLADALKLHITGDISGFIQALSFNGLKLGAGVAARARVPKLRLSPVVGIAYSKNEIVGTITPIYGSLDVDARFITPSAGLEFQVTPSIYVGAGLNFPWMSHDEVIRYNRAEGLFPYLQIGIH